MKRKKIGKLVGLMGAAMLSLGIFACPATTVSAKAAAENEIMPCSDIIRWRLKLEDGKMYKRLYNFSTGNWIGDWIYLGVYE